jgi:hypothetical protein
MIVVAVEIGQLLEVVWVSLLAGVGVTTCFSFVILGSAKMADARRNGREAAAMGYGALAVGALLVVAGVAAFGVEVMLAK